MVDLSFLENFTKGNGAKMKRYIQLYLQIAPECLGRMKKNIGDENWKDLAINAHSLKPQADFMGIATLKETLINIEDAVKQGKIEPLEGLYEQAYQLHEEATAILNEKLNSN